MTPIRSTWIEVWPQTNVRMVGAERWLLNEKVTDEYLQEKDEQRLIKEGKKGTLRSRKKQLVFTMEHKKEIMAWVTRNGFKMPFGHSAIWFYVPMPVSWRKWKRLEMLYTVHQSTPDLDNYLKQLFDSVMPRKNRQSGEKGSDDRKVYNYAAFKVWVPREEAGMKIVEYDLFDFMDAFRHGHPSYRQSDLPVVNIQNGIGSTASACPG